MPGVLRKDDAAMREAYKTAGPGHVYRGRNIGRGCRQLSKIYKALKGMATYALLDEVARDDERRRRGRQYPQEQAT